MRFDGPGLVPAISLRAEPSEVFAGGILGTAWAGIPTPGPSDELRLYSLGSGSDNFDHVARWMTTGVAQGVLNLEASFLPSAAALTHELVAAAPSSEPPLQ